MGISFYTKKGKALLHLLQYARHVGIFKTANVLKKRLYCKVSGYPNSFMFEAASRCNLRCSMCWAYRADEHRRSNFLKYEEYKKIIDDIEGYCSKVFFSFCGEPLMNKDIYRMIGYANDKDMVVGLSTNANLLTENNVVRLLESRPYEMVVSLDSADKGTYEKMRVGGDFDKVISGVRFLTSEKKRRRLATPRVILQMILTKHNEDGVDEFIRLGKVLQADRVVIKSLFIDSHGDNGYIKRLADEFVTSQPVSRYSSVDEKGAVLKKAGACPNTASPVIASDGDVYICCFDIFGEHRRGNAVKDNFGSIWKSQAYARFRKETMHGRKLPICRSCGYEDVPEINIPL